MSRGHRAAAAKHRLAALTVVQEARPPFIPEGAEVMTVIIEFPPGDPGTPPHRHPGPAFGYMLEGEMRFELEGEPERVIRAGEAFWEPGGDVIHYRDGNNRTDIRSRFVVPMLCVPGKPMLTLVDEDELAQRKDDQRTAAHLSNWPRFRVLPSPGMSRDDYSTAESPYGVRWSLRPSSRAAARALVEATRRLTAVGDAMAFSLRRHASTPVIGPGRHGSVRNGVDPKSQGRSGSRRDPGACPERGSR